MRSISIPGNIRSSAECPPASSACVWRDCGVPERGAGALGNESRSNTVTFSKCGAITFAAASPAIPAPTTTACLKLGLHILDTSTVKRVSRPLAAFPAPSPRRLTTLDATTRRRRDHEFGSYRRRNPSVLVPNLSRWSAPHSDGDHTADPNNRGESTQLRERHHMLRTPKSRKALRKLREMADP
jgi:hypothetical protein